MTVETITKDRIDLTDSDNVVKSDGKTKRLKHKNTIKFNIHFRFNLETLLNS